MVIQKDGFPTIISFSEDTSVLMEEKEVTPPGISGGGEIDTTTMRNSAMRTKAPKSLYSTTDASVSAAYDPAFLDEVLAMVLVNQEITFTYPDLSTVVIWGWVDEFTPGSQVEGEQPTCDVTIIVSNENDEGVETAPEYGAPPE